MPYWAAARLQLHRESLALNFLKLRGFDTYLPRIRECRMVRGRRLMITPPLFPGYAFIGIELAASNGRILKAQSLLPHPSLTDAGARIRRFLWPGESKLAGFAGLRDLHTPFTRARTNFQSPKNISAPTRKG